MATATSICYYPSSKFLVSKWFKQRCLKHTSFAPSISTSRSIFCSGFVLGKAVSGRNRLMDDSIRTCAFRNRTSDEGLQVVEQEASIDGSSEVGSKFAFHRFESIVNRLSKWIMSAIFSGIFLWRHDAQALWFAAGSSLNVMLSVELKHMLNQERPSTLKSDPGMPSSHAQTIFYIAMFSVLLSVEWLGMNNLTITAGGLVLALGCYISYLRVSQQLHTASQVVVGAGIGTIFCICWYWLWNALVLDAIGSSLWVKIIIVLGSAGIWITHTSNSILQGLRKE